MAGNKNIFLLLFIFFVALSQAQENRVFTSPDIIQKNNSFALPELQVDSAFIECFDSLFFVKENYEMSLMLSNPKDYKKMRHFHIDFKKNDSLNYSISVSLWDIPARKSIGFFEHNEYFYWLGGDIPSNIILKTKLKKFFSYEELGLYTYDPPFWTLIYHSQTETIEIKEEERY